VSGTDRLSCADDPAGGELRSNGGPAA
jgi:hypothetical protein